jgi:hypothetical protein
VKGRIAVRKAREQRVVTPRPDETSRSADRPHCPPAMRHPIYNLFPMGVGVQVGWRRSVDVGIGYGEMGRGD